MVGGKLVCLYDLTVCTDYQSYVPTLVSVVSLGNDVQYVSGSQHHLRCFRDTPTSDQYISGIV